MVFFPRCILLVPCFWVCCFTEAFIQRQFHRPTTRITMLPYHAGTRTDSTGNSIDRRSWIKNVLATGAFASASNILIPVTAVAASEDPVPSIREATETLQTLLDNWNKAVIDCTYADVPRELLETKNKELLLEKASTFALFDKSVSVVSCKTSNRIVRDYLGKSGIGPLVGLDKKIRRGLDLVEDPDDLDVYVQASEAIQQALSNADSLSYTAGVADFSAVNNFDKKDVSTILASNSKLGQAREAIQDAVDNLNRILTILST
jgi:hypothetical protein